MDEKLFVAFGKVREAIGAIERSPFLNAELEATIKSARDDLASVEKQFEERTHATRVAGVIRGLASKCNEVKAALSSQNEKLALDEMWNLDRLIVEAKASFPTEAAAGIVEA